MAFDALTGVATAEVGSLFSKFLQSKGWITIEDLSRGGSQPMQKVSYLPGVGYFLENTREPVYLSEEQFQRLLAAWVAGNLELAQQILEQSVEKAAEDAVNP